MRIALVRNHEAGANSRQSPLLRRAVGAPQHLGLAYIATALARRGHDVILLDAPAMALGSRDLERRLAAFQPRIVGVTATLPGLPGALAACAMARRIGALTVLGGSAADSYPTSIMENGVVDYVGVGDGASIMVELAERLRADQSPEGVQGLMGRDSGPVGRAPLLDLEAIGWPSRLAEAVAGYRSALIRRRPAATMISARGCPYRCAFCSQGNEPVLFRSPADVVEEMADLTTRLGVRWIQFYDDVFTLKRSRLLEICDRLIVANLDVHWEAPTRVDLVDRELVGAMYRAGCRRLRFGIETGDPAMTRAMGKRFTLETVRTAVAASRAAGIETFGYFIVGYLGESRESFEATLDFALSLPLDLAGFSTAIPLPDTELFRQSVAAGKIAADYWERWSRGEPMPPIGPLVPGGDRRSAEAYRRFYIRPERGRFLLRTLLNRGTGVATATALARLAAGRAR